MTKSNEPVKTKVADGADSSSSISSIVAKMFGCCLLALLIQTLVALFPSFVVNKVTHEKKGGIGSTDPHHSRAKAERVNELHGNGVEVPLPIVCAHRGINDANRTVNSTAAALLSLCMEHRICCADYDVSSTNDGVLVVGTPGDLHRHLFPSTGNASEGYGEPQVRDYTWKDLQERDPEGKYFTELRTIVDVATALKGIHDRRVFMTIEPKASNPRLRKSLVERMAPLFSPNPDMFAVIMRSEDEAPDELRTKAENFLQNYSSSSSKGDGNSRVGGGQDSNPRTIDHLGLGGKSDLNASQLPQTLQGLIHFAYTLRDRSLDELTDSTITKDQKLSATKGKASTEAHTAKHGKRTVSFVGGKAFPKDNLVKALKMCSNLCPKRGPHWAKFIMPSHRFVKTCSNIRYAALRDFGQAFYREHFGQCLRVNGPDHAKHILWVLDEQKDFFQLPGQYHPAFVVSNLPVTVRNKLMDGEIRM